MSNYSDLLTSKEAAEYLRIEISTLYQLTSKRKIKHTKPNGNRVYFRKEWLDNYIDRGVYNGSDNEQGDSSVTRKTIHQPHKRLLIIVCDPEILSSCGMGNRDIDIFREYMLKESTYKNIGNAHGLSKDRVYQIIHLCNRKIRSTLSKIKEFKRLDEENKELKSEIHTIKNQIEHNGQQPNTEKIPIEDLDLGARAYNVLKGQAGIDYLQDFKDTSKHAIVKYRNFGKKSLSKVVDELERYGIDLTD